MSIVLYKGMIMEHMDRSLHELVVRAFAAIEARDLDALIGLLADDAVVIDTPVVCTSRRAPRRSASFGAKRRLT